MSFLIANGGYYLEPSLGSTWDSAVFDFLVEADLGSVYLERGAAMMIKQE